jgi:hypothetical protein
MRTTTRDLNIFAANKLKKELDTDPFFKVLDSNIIINNNGERIELKLDEISNIRIGKFRNLSVNILLFFSVILFYYLALPFLYSYSVVPIFSTLIIPLAILVTFSIKKYTYKLLINTGVYGFNVFKISKKNVSSFEYFISMFKTNYMTDNKNNQSYDDLDDFRKCM